MSHVDRQALEASIYDLSSTLKKNPASNCYDADAIDQFLEAWNVLAKHYQYSEDTDISVITVREYLRWAHTFGAYAQSPNVSSDCQEISVQARDELGGFMNDILVAVADKLNLPD